MQRNPAGSLEPVRGALRRAAGCPQPPEVLKPLAEGDEEHAG